MITTCQHFLSTVMISRWWYWLSVKLVTRWHYYIDAVMVTRWRYYLSESLITRLRYWLNAVMVTRWQYCFNAAMITRWHYCISVAMVTGWWMCLTAKNFGLQEKNIKISNQCQRLSQKKLLVIRTYNFTKLSALMKSCGPKKRTLRILSKQATAWESHQRSDTVASAAGRQNILYACVFDFVPPELDAEPVAAGAPLPLASESAGAGS